MVKKIASDFREGRGVRLRWTSITSRVESGYSQSLDAAECLKSLGSCVYLHMLVKT